MSDPTEDPWSNTPRVDPRQNLPHLSWTDALKKLMTSVGVSPDTQAALASAAAHLQMQGRMDAYFNGFFGKYTVGGATVSAAPFFRMANGAAGSSESLKAKVFAVTGRRTAEFNMAVHMCAYGRCNAEQLQTVTQALIDKGKLAEVRQKYDAMSEADFRAQHGSASRPLSDENAIKMMQYDYGLGVDCAGYVQQAFLDVHGGSRQDWGLQPRIGDEDLSNLKNNRNFDRATSPANTVPGDLMFLSPPAPGDVGHTVLVRDRAELTADQARGLTGLDTFASPGDKVQRVELQGSWGASYGNLDKGGLQNRVVLYNEASGKWADVERGAVVPHDKGPYDHPLEGIYHPKREMR